jgi:uncharacterized damage-inducible protein DinB
MELADYFSDPVAYPTTLLTQITAHGVQHRAEIGLMLETIGRSAGDLDYLLFKMEQLEEG